MFYLSCGPATSFDLYNIELQKLGINPYTGKKQTSASPPNPNDAFQPTLEQKIKKGNPNASRRALDFWTKQKG